MTDLAKLIRFDRLTPKARTAAARGGRVTFTEPCANEGKEVVNMELHQKVRALITESKRTNPDRPLTYAEGYTLAKEEGRKQVTFNEPLANEGKEVVGIELDQRVRTFMAESAKNGKVIRYTEAYPIVRKQMAEEKEGGTYA